MFEIGEKIFYPMHGAGVIVDIQEKEILNQVEKFYVAKMPGEVKLMLPVKSAENLGLRPLVSEEEANRYNLFTIRYKLFYARKLD